MNSADNSLIGQSFLVRQSIPGNEMSHLLCKCQREFKPSFVA